MHSSSGSKKKAPQSRGMSAMLRKLASRRVAKAFAVSALFGLGGHTALAATYNMSAAGNFSTGFTPPIASNTSIDNQLTFSGTSAYTATDDITALTLNSMTFSSTGLVTITPSVATNVITMATSSAGLLPSINVGTNGATINAILAGASFVKTGSGNLTLATNADTYTGNVFVNAGTLTLNIGQSSTAGFVLNSGALAGSVGLANTNFVYANTGTSAVSIQGASNTLGALFEGNANIAWNEATVNNDSYSNTIALNIFGNFGGTVAWGTNNSGIRVQASTGSGANALEPFANFDLGSAGGNLSMKIGTSVLVLGGLQGTGTTDAIGGSAGGHALNNVVGGANLTQTFAGNILNSAGGGDEFTKVGTGILTLTGFDTATTTYNGSGADGFSNDVAGGTLLLDHSVNASGMLVSTSALEIAQGGTLSLKGKSSGASTETVASLTVNGGGGRIVINPNGGSSTTFNLGGITASAAGSTLGITENTGTAVVTTTTAKSADGTYGGRITFTDASGVTNFATSTGSTPFTLSGYTGYTNYTGGTGTATVDYAANDSQSVAATSMNLLKVTNDTTGQVLTLAGNLVLTNAGLLFTGPNAETITGGSINNAAAVVLQDYGTGALTVSSSITGASTLTVGGSGTVILNGGTNNTYTMPTYIDSGATISVGDNDSLGITTTGATLNLFGGTLKATSTFGLFNGSAGTNNRAVSIGGGGGTFDVTGSNNLTVAGVVSNTTGNLFGPLIKTDTGTLTLTGTNTYTGATIINGGILSAAVLANGNTNSSIGNAPSTANALILNGGTLQYSGSTAATTDRTFTIGTTGALDASGTSGSTVAFTNFAPVWFSGTSNDTLTLTGTNTGSNTLAGVIGDANSLGITGISGTTSVNKTGAGTWLLTGANTYSGGTTISNGTLLVGNSSAIGTGPLAINSATLDLNNFSTTAGALNGTGGTVKNGQSGAATLTVGGTSGGSTYAGVIQNGSGTVSLAKAGGDTLTLTGTNTYTGATTVGGTGGGLTIGSGGSLGNTAITVGTGVMFAATPGTGSITIGSGTGASLNLNSGSTFSLVDGTAGTLNFNGSAVIGGSTGIAPALSFDVGSTSADILNLSSGVTFGIVGGKIFITGFGSSALSGITNYTLINAASGLGTSAFTLGTTSLAFGSSTYALSLSNSTATQEILTLSPASLDYYFTGALGSSFATSGNFATDHTGATAQTGTPAAANNVFLTADNGVNLTPTLDGSYTINSLSFTGGSTPAASSITLSSGTGGSLTLNASNSFKNAAGTTYAAGTGLVVQSGSGAHSISANLNLAANQTFEIDNSATNPLTISGAIGDGGSGYSLTKTGVGTLLLTAANSYTGGTNINAGSLQSGVVNALATTGTLSVKGTFDLEGFNQTIASLSDGGVSTGIVTSSSGTPTLTIGGSNTTSFSGVLSGSLALTQAGSGTQTLSGSNLNTGATTVSSGTLIAASDTALSTSSGLTMSGTGIVKFTSASPSIATLSGASGNSIVLGNTAVPSATTLTVASTGSTANTTFAGIISDGGATASGSLLLNGGSLTLSGPNTYLGTTTLASGSTLTIGTALALQNSTLNYSAGTLVFGTTVTAATIGALSGTQNIALINTAGTPSSVALTTGGNNGTTTYSGALSGAGSFAKNGSGTLTLSGANTYTGTTSIGGGTVNLTGSLGTTPTPTGAITATSGTLSINGGTISAASLTGVANGTFISLTSGGSITLTGNLGENIASSQLSSGGLIYLNSGTVNANSASLGRSTSFTTLPTAGDTGDGLYVNGATLNLTNTLNIGNIGGTNSSANMRIDSGSVTVGGTTAIADNNSRYSILDINGGTFTSNDTTGAGILIGSNVSPYSYGELLVRNGTLNTNEITLGSSTQTTVGSIEVFTANGGTTYIGSGGIVLGGATSATTTVNLGSGTVTTAPIIGALANWSSSVPMTLTNSSTAAPVTFQTADSTGTAHNITLTGYLTGSGGLAKTGAGTLTLTAGNSYTGITAINAGTLNINGEYALGGAVYGGTTFNGGTLQYATAFSGNGSGDITQNSAGTPVAKPVTISAGGATIDTNGNNVTYANTIGNSGTGSLTKAGAGILTLQAADNYSGGTTVSAGTITAPTSGYSTGTVTIASGATADYTQNTTSSYAAGITGSGSVTMGANPGGGLSNGGTINYSGADTAGGGTTVTGETLQLNNTSGPALASAPLTVATGGVVGIQSDNQIATSVNVTLLGTGDLAANGHNEGAGTKNGVTTPTQGAGTLQIGNGTAAATATIDFGDPTGSANSGAGNVLAFADSSTLTWNGTVNIANYTGSVDQLYIGTTADLTTTQLGEITFGGVGGATQLANGEVVIPAPEPSGWVSMLAGAGLLSGIIARKRRKASDTLAA